MNAPTYVPFTVKRMTSFKDEAHKRAIAAEQATRIATERARHLEASVKRIVTRVEQEKDWLERQNLRVFFDNRWEPNFGIRICRRFDGRAPTSESDNEMECCSIYTGGEDLRYALIEFNHVDVVYLEDEAAKEDLSDEDLWVLFVKKVCERFDLADRDEPGSLPR